MSLLQIGGLNEALCASAHASMATGPSACTGIWWVLAPGAGQCNTHRDQELAWRHHQKANKMQRSSSRWCASALIAAMVLAGRSCAAKTSAAAGGDAAPTHAGLGPSSLYFRQLCPGDEIATSGSELHAMARSMNNFIYVIGDRDTREAVVIDACWDVEGVVEAVRADGMNITKAFATHYHFDHIGGLRGGIRFFSAQPRPVLRNLAPALCL